ncbi:hypothetical protein [Duganella vulcania]|uniref:PKD domain-containing protein n=1 Tax=Duganella vulcania TaxID=2692166 RepID=A0A845GHB2_9BURK|nr:hypothetical protein [Duganella vulcania]MYM92795.1 hypothetical protein [Duganella vulcania]
MMQKFLSFMISTLMLVMSMLGGPASAQTFGQNPTLIDPYNWDHSHIGPPISYTRSNGNIFQWRPLTITGTMNMSFGDYEAAYGAGVPFFTSNIIQRDSDPFNGEVVLLSNGDLYSNGITAASVSAIKYGSTVSYANNATYSKINDGVAQFSLQNMDGTKGWSNSYVSMRVVKSDGTVWSTSSNTCSSTTCAGAAWTQYAGFDGISWCYDDAAYSSGTSMSGGRASASTFVCYRKTDAKFYTYASAGMFQAPTLTALTTQLALPPLATSKGYTWDNAIASRRLGYLILKSGEVVSLTPNMSATVFTLGPYSMYPALMAIASDMPPNVQDIQMTSALDGTTDRYVLTTDGKIYVRGNNTSCMLGNGCAPVNNWTPFVSGGVTSMAATYLGLYYYKSDKVIYYKGAQPVCPSDRTCSNSNFNVGVVVQPSKITPMGAYNFLDESPAHTLADGISGPIVVTATDGTVESDVSISVPFVPGVASFDLYVGANSDGSDATKIKSGSYNGSAVQFSVKDTNQVCSGCTANQTLWAGKLAGPEGGKKLYFKVVGNGYPLTPGTVNGSDDGYPSMPLDSMTMKINGIYNGTGSASPTFDNANLRYGTRQVYTTAIASQPANAGKVTKQGDGSFLLTAAANFTGDDSFLVTSTDLAGASFTKPANIHVDCPAPTIKGLKFGSQPVMNSGRVIVTYDAPACATNLGIALQLKLGNTIQGNLVQSDAGMTQLPTGTNQQVSVNYSGVVPNTYKIVVTMVDSTWKHPATQEFPFAITDFTTTNFALTADNWAPRAYVDSINVTSTNSGAPLCTLSMKDTVARSSSTALTANPSASLVCQFEWVNVPGGLVQAKDSDQPKLTGVLIAEGAQEIDYQVSVFTDSGDKVTFKHGTQTFAAARPVNPTQSIAPFNGTALYVVPANGGSVAKVSVDAMNGAGVLTKFQIDAGPVQQFSTAKGTFTRTIDMGATDLWSHHSLLVHTQYSNKDSIFTEQTVDVLTSPNEKTKALLTAPASSFDNVPTPMSVSVGIPGSAYDQAVDGVWMVSLAKTAADGSLVPITDPVQTVNGVAQINAPPLNTMNPQKITAIADVVSPVSGYSKRIYSDFKPLTFEKGSALEGALVIPKTSGQAPFVTTVTVKMASKDDKMALKSTDFYQSTDGGTTWTKIGKPDESVSGRMVHLFASGAYKVKGIFLNKNTGITSESPTIDVVSYVMPILTVSGGVNAFAGTPINLKALFAPEKGQPAVDMTGADAPVTEWLVDGATTPTVGSSLSLESDTAKTVHVIVRARSAVANPSDPTVWTTQRLVVKFLAVASPKIQLSGPVRAETGKVSTFTARVTAPWSPATSVNEVNGEWTLPNGTVVPGMALNWTPDASDASPDKKPLHFRAWVNGYDDKGASKTADIGVLVWQYIWPDFQWVIKQDTTYAPSVVKLDVTESNPKLMSQFANEKLTVTYTFPDSVDVQRNKGTAAQLRLAAQGNYPVNLVLADTRGNSTTLNTNLLAIQALPYVISVKTSPSNALWREPVNVTVRASATGGHPSDHVLSYAFAVDGQPIDSKGTGAQFRLPAAGDHVLQVSLTSTFGATQVQQFPLTVIANKPPVCKLASKTSVSTRSVGLEATCSDVDGKVVGYQWWVNDSKVGSTGTKVSLPMPDPGQSLSATVQATDDSGGTGSATVNLQF